MPLIGLTNQQTILQLTDLISQCCIYKTVQGRAKSRYNVQVSVFIGSHSPKLVNLVISQDLPTAKGFNLYVDLLETDPSWWQQSPKKTKLYILCSRCSTSLWLPAPPLTLDWNEWNLFVLFVCVTDVSVLMSPNGMSRQVQHRSKVHVVTGNFSKKQRAFWLKLCFYHMVYGLGWHRIVIFIDVVQIRMSYLSFNPQSGAT